MSKILFFVACFGVLVALSSAATLWDLVNSRRELSTMRKFITQRHLEGQFREPGDFTVFAPSNSAFSSQSQANINYMNNPSNEQDMKRIILFHIIRGRKDADTLLDSGSATTYNGLTLNFYDDGSTTYVENARLVTTNIKADNGYLNIIDHVLIPPGSTLPDASGRRLRLLGLNHNDDAAAEIESNGEILPESDH